MKSGKKELPHQGIEPLTSKSMLWQRYHWATATPMFLRYLGSHELSLYTEGKPYVYVMIIHLSPIHEYIYLKLPAGSHLTKQKGS